MAKAKTERINTKQFRFEGFNFIVVGKARKQLTAIPHETRKGHRPEADAEDIVFQIEHGREVGSDILFSNGDPLAILLAIEEAEELGIL